MMRFWTSCRAARRFGDMWRGMPALLAIVGLLALTGWGRFLSRDTLAARYVILGDTALQAKQTDVADILYRKAAQLAPENWEGRFGKYLVASQRKDIAREQALLNELAPGEVQGHAPAHFIMAKRLLQSKHELSRDELKLIRHHLERTVTYLPGNCEAQYLLAQVYVSLSQDDEAAVSIQWAVPGIPWARTALARMFLKRGNKKAAEVQLQQACRDLARQVQAKPRNVAARLCLAEAEILSGNPQRAVEHLLAGHALQPDERIAKGLGGAYFVRAMQVRDQPQLHVQFLQEALKWAPHDLAVLRALAGVAEQRTHVRQILEAMLVEGAGSATVHLILGVAAAEEGDMRRAILHLEQAHQLDPQMVPVLNNLAWFLSHTNPVQLERALNLAGAAVAAAPGNPEVHETRGQILALAGRWAEALTDLSIALKRFPNRPTLHRTLAMAYEQLGDLELAARHDELADQATSEPPLKPAIPH